MSKTLVGFQDGTERVVDGNRFTCWNSLTFDEIRKVKTLSKVQL